MKNTYIKIAFISLVLFLMLGMTPASSRQAAAANDHPMDQALLLMFSSHMRMIGDVESARISIAHLAAPSSQTQADIDNEINAVIDLYVAMIANLQASGNYSRAVEDQLVAQMNEKVDALQAKAQALEAKRSNSSQGGFIRSIGRVVNRVFKAVGRGTGWVVGKAMDGAAEVGVFAVEEVTPRVLREYALGGTPLNAKLFRHVARELLKKRVRTAAENYVLRLAERINRQQAAQGEALPTLDAVAQATKDAFTDDLMEAFDEGDQNQLDPPAGSSGGSSGGTSGSSPDVVVYDFTLNDAIHDWQSWSNDFGWSNYWIEVEGSGYCFNRGFNFDQASIHLEFNTAEMTVSGYIDASGQGSGGDNMPWNASASARVEFEDIPGDPDFTQLDYIAWSFIGTGYGTGSISGTVTCRQYNESINDSVYIPTSAQLTHNREEYYIRIDLFQPGEEVTLEETIEVSGSNGYGTNGWGMGWSLDFNQPIDVMLP